MEIKKLKLCVALALVAALICGAPPPYASASTSARPWDGTIIDVSWYSPDAKEYVISTPEQIAGLAAIVNGIYNKSVTTIIGDASVIVSNKSDSAEDSGGGNLSTDGYYYGADDFSGKTVRLTADLDMGGRYDPSTGMWSGPNYMPIGGQYLMEKNNSETKIGSSFCGVLDGQGHTIYNVYCDRHCATGNYGDGQSVGLVGRLGVHDGDPESSRPANAAVRNLAVTGYVYANRSVGGVVGKIGKTNGGAVIENCANFATVASTDAKGCGGIVGSSWNGGLIQNCYNAGNISSSYTGPTGGISGSNEISIRNCYNTGKISSARDSYAMGIGTNNGGGAGAGVDNCFWLTASAPGGGYYGMTTGSVTELSAAEMKEEGFLLKLEGAFIADTNGINGGYPILAWQKNAVVHTPPEPIKYSDVNDSAWYADAVRYVMDAGLFDARDGKFSPEAPMTREMVVTALVRLGGDASKITDGTNPQNSVTREQFATMLHRFAGLPAGGASLGGFTDADEVHDWARDGVSWAVGAGLINGMGDGRIAPLGTATRAQAAAMIRRFVAAAG